jgi:DNA segregation ATPase FtsK/SpoIIIE, S-DNA-T family
MVDPKRVELSSYNGIPHLMAPVVVEPEKVVGVLNWLTREMDRRYKVFARVGARNIQAYNEGAGSRRAPSCPTSSPLSTSWPT